MHEFFTVDYEYKFPISRDPPEGGTIQPIAPPVRLKEFPISRDPPEGGTFVLIPYAARWLLIEEVSNF